MADKVFPPSLDAFYLTADSETIILFTLEVLTVILLSIFLSVNKS